MKIVLQHKGISKLTPSLKQLDTKAYGDLKLKLHIFMSSQTDESELSALLIDEIPKPFSRQRAIKICPFTWSL